MRVAVDIGRLGSRIRALVDSFETNATSGATALFTSSGLQTRRGVLQTPSHVSPGQQPAGNEGIGRTVDRETIDI